MMNRDRILGSKHKNLLKRIFDNMIKFERMFLTSQFINKLNIFKA